MRVKSGQSHSSKTLSMTSMISCNFKLSSGLVDSKATEPITRQTLAFYSKKKEYLITAVDLLWQIIWRTRAISAMTLRWTWPPITGVVKAAAKGATVVITVNMDLLTMTWRGNYLTRKRSAWRSKNLSIRREKQSSYVGKRLMPWSLSFVKDLK